LIFKRSYC